MRRSLALGVVFVAGLSASAYAQPAGAQYIAASWNNDAIVWLDSSLNFLGTFANGDFGGVPNGVAAGGGLLFGGTFSPNNTVRAYDQAGVFQFGWSLPNDFGLQAMEYVNGNIAIAHGQISFYDAGTGAFQGSWADPNGGDTEAIAYDGGNNLLFTLNDGGINAYDATSGAFQYVIPNPAAGNSFGGTGLTYIGGNSLVVGTVEGDWYQVDSTNGALQNSGNNGVDMFGLKIIPSPASFALLGMGGLFAARRRR